MKCVNMDSEANQLYNLFFTAEVKGYEHLF